MTSGLKMERAYSVRSRQIIQEVNKEESIRKKGSNERKRK